MIVINIFLAGFSLATGLFMAHQNQVGYALFDFVCFFANVLFVIKGSLDRRANNLKR